MVFLNSQVSLNVSMLNWVIQFLFHINDLYVTEENVKKKEMNKDLKADFTIWKDFSAIFPFKKKTIQFPLSSVFIFNKEEPQFVNLPLTYETLFEFLAKSCTLFWKYS